MRELLEKKAVVAECEEGVYVAPLVKETQTLMGVECSQVRPDLKRVTFERRDKD